MVEIVEVVPVGPLLVAFLFGGSSSFSPKTYVSRPAGAKGGFGLFCFFYFLIFVFFQIY